MDCPNNKERGVTVQLPPLRFPKGPKLHVPIRSCATVGQLCKTIATQEGSGKQVLRLLYPPFDAGIVIPETAPVSVLECLTEAAVVWRPQPVRPSVDGDVDGADDADGADSVEDIVVVATKDRGLTKAAADDEKDAVAIDKRARQASIELCGPRLLLLKDQTRKYAEEVPVREFKAMLSHLPYQLLRQIQSGAKDEPWYKFIDEDVVNQCLLREEWGIRRAFLYSGFSETKQIVPLYDTNGGLITIHKRELTSVEKLHPRIDGKLPTKGDYNSHLELQPSLTHFKMSIDNFTHKILDDVWDGHDGAEVFLAGGAVLGCLAYPEFNEMNSNQKAEIALAKAVQEIPFLSPNTGILPDIVQSNIKKFLDVSHFVIDLESETTKKRNTTRQKEPFADSDLDLFIAAESIESGRAAMRKVLMKIRKNMLYHNCTQGRVEQVDLNTFEKFENNDGDDENVEFNSSMIRLLRSANAISVWGGPDNNFCRTVQVILVLYKTKEQVLQFFDLDCIAIGYDGHNVWGLPRSLRALATGYNFVEPAKLRRWSTGPRILKYVDRGFGTVFSEICRHHPRCDHAEHLPEEMVLKISALNARTTASDDLGYGEVVLPFGSTNVRDRPYSEYYPQQGVSSGSNLDDYVRNVMHHAGPGEWYWERDVIRVANKWAYLQGNKSASTENIDCLLEEINGLPSVRWKENDLFESRRGNEFLPKCYQCDQRIDPTNTVSERPRICSICEQLNAAKVSMFTDLNGYTALVTGGRCRIGYAIAVRLLRQGANVIITTRFPKTAAAKYAIEEDFDIWSTKLDIYGVDFRKIGAVIRLGTELSSKYPTIHGIFNNAAQTIRRPKGWFMQLMKSEALALKDNVASLISRTLTDPDSVVSEGLESSPENAQALVPITQAVAMAGDELHTSLFDGTDIDGEPIDPRSETSWTATMDVVHPVEFLEVQLVNVHAPWTLIQMLRPNLKAAASGPTKHIALVVNVTSAEGSFSQFGETDETVGQKGGKSPKHPHTNMAKAALNMLTYSVSKDFEKDGISIVSVDTGWVSQMTPQAGQMAPHITSQPPLSCEDGAARVLDPFLNWAKNDIPPPTGRLLRHFEIGRW